MTATRREVLKGTVGPIAIAAVGSIAAVAVVRNDADPVVDLGRQWTAIQEKIARLDKDYDERYAKLPEWAKLGWPDISDLPAFKPPSVSYGVLGRRPSLEEVKRCNEIQTTKPLRPDEPNYQKSYLRRKSDGRARIRAWIARRREQLALQQEVGLEESEDRAEQARCVRDDIEDVIWETPARSIEGVAVKLRIYITRDGEIDEETTCFFPGLLVSAVHDAERLAGRGQS